MNHWRLVKIETITRKHSQVLLMVQYEAHVKQRKRFKKRTMRHTGKYLAEVEKNLFFFFFFISNNGKSLFALVSLSGVSSILT